MTNESNADQGITRPVLSPPVADAFARITRRGDEMIGYGILMAIAAIAIGFGLQFEWWPLGWLGGVLLWIFGPMFADARDLHSQAKADLEAFERGGSAAPEIILPPMLTTGVMTGIDPGTPTDVPPQASQGL